MTTLMPDDQDELGRAIADAVTGVLDCRGKAAGLSPLSWTISAVEETEFEGAHRGGEGDAGAELLCIEWAEFLGLREEHGGDEGCRAWAGELGNMRLRLFAIIDMDLYASIYLSDAG